VRSVDLVETKLQIRFHDQTGVEPARIVEMVARLRGSLTPSGMLQLPAPPRGAARIESVTKLLTTMLAKV
jgi:hypothetical protein